MLPLMIVLGLILQRPLDRAMKRLQAESAARHGVLVESLSGLETVRATGAEARMQTPGSARSPPRRDRARTCISGPRWR